MLNDIKNFFNFKGMLDFALFDIFFMYHIITFDDIFLLDNLIFKDISNLRTFIYIFIIMLFFRCNFMYEYMIDFINKKIDGTIHLKKYIKMNIIIIVTLQIIIALSHFLIIKNNMYIPSIGIFSSKYYDSIRNIVTTISENSGITFRINAYILVFKIFIKLLIIQTLVLLFTNKINDLINKKRNKDNNI